MKKFTLIVFCFLIAGYASAQKKVNPTYVAPTNSSHYSDIDLSKGLKAGPSISVAILCPDSTLSTDLVSTRLSTFTDLTVTTISDANIAALTVGNLSTYQACIAYNDRTWESVGGARANIGNVLSQYIDGGGKVIECLFLKSFDNWGVAGTYVSGGYSAFGSTTTDSWDTASTMGTVVTPTHPIMTGVTSLEQYFDTQDPTLATGATQIVDWNSGDIAIAAKPSVVSFNFLPADPSGIETIGGDAWTAIHNAIVWMIASAGIQDISGTEISIYPNPVTDQLHINAGTTEGTLTITNSLGAVVYQQQINSNTTVNTSNYNSGLYFVRVESSNNVSTTKFMVE
ncbi:MAG TPA: T9SS type A sorting domain-containing protein [Bacteroidales bacterium]|nr:T9SS type A sorting domain-containing protein [Bacteroidales bacterium]